MGQTLSDDTDRRVSVLLGDRIDVPPVVLGVEMPPVTDAEFDVLLVLKKYEPHDVAIARLAKESGHSQPDKILRKLIKKCPRWGKVILFPGGKGKGGIRFGK
jgi:hypothetical protein